MKVATSLLLALALATAGCTQLKQMYGISDPAVRLTPEGRAALVAQSVRDSSAVFGDDTTYYIGRPVFRCDIRPTGYSGITTVDLVTFPGMATAMIYPEDPSSDPSAYIVILETPHKILSATSRAGAEPIVTQLMRNNVLTGGSHEYNAANLRRAVAGGLFRERPDLDTLWARQRRADIEAARTRGSSSGSSSTARRSTPSSGSSSSSSTASKPKEKIWRGNPSLRNTCRETVRLFIGDNPGYSSGLSTSASGNSINASFSRLEPGAKLWIVDEKQKPINSMIVPEGAKEIQITSDGKGFKVEMWPE